MSLFRLSWRFFTRKSGSKKINISSFLPIVGVSLGTLTIILTFAIMDGLEKDIFGALQNFSGGTIINTNKVSINDKNLLKSYLEKNKLNYTRFIKRKAILQFDGNSKIVNVRAFSNIKFAMGGFFDFKESNFKQNLIIIGNELSNRLNISQDDSLKLISPLDLKFSSAVLPEEKLVVSGIFSTRLLDFDLNSVFISYENGKTLFKKSGNIGFYFKDKIILPNKILNIKNIEIKYWDEIHKNLVGAMRLEKVAYVAFGFLLILISGFSLLSTMSISIIQKMTQIGILKTIGFSNHILITIFIWFSTISGIFGVLIAISLSFLIKIIEDTKPFIHLIFGNYPYLEFPILLNIEKIFWVCLVSIIAIILSSIYPAIKASKLNPVQSIGIK